MIAFTNRLNSRSEEHTSEFQSLRHLVCRLLLEKKKCEVEFAGIGLPNETVTGYGLLLGHFQKKRPISKRKMLPHRRSNCTVMMVFLSTTATPDIPPFPPRTLLPI